MGRLFIICAERIINSKPKKTGHIYRERIRPTYSTPYVGQVLPQELKQEKHREHKAHRSAHPQRAGRAGGRTHPHTTATALRRRTTGRAGKAQGTPQDRRTGTAQAEHTAPRRSTAHRRKNKRVHKSTSRCAIVVAWSTRGQTTRSHPTTPLAPLREDMAQGIRACAMSSFACRRGTASP